MRDFATLKLSPTTINDPDDQLMVIYKHDINFHKK